MKEKIIVSLTSYPARIHMVSQVIQTLMIQIERPDMIILWLAEEEFPQKEQNLPEDILALVKYGLTIRWCDNLKPHKKYFYAMQEFPDDIIITVDDDVYYSPRLVGSLIDAYKENKHSVICSRANRIIRPKDGRTFNYSEFKFAVRGVCYFPLTDVLPTGVGGVLYPPHSIPKEAFNKKLINELCLCQDDIWLKIWSLLNGYTDVIVKDKIYIDTIDEFQENCLFLENKEGGNDLAIQLISEWMDREYYEGILIDKLFEKGKCIEDYWGIYSPYNDELKNEILKRFSEREIYIYGAGKGAELVTRILKNIGDLRPKYYIVADKKSNPDIYFGIDVKGMDEIKPPINPYLIIISPAEKHHKKIIKDLTEKGWKNILKIRDEWMGELISSDKREEEAVFNTLFEFLREDDLNGS